MIEYRGAKYQYPPLAIFGAGNSVEIGISPGTELNARTAVSYLSLGSADPEVAFLLGYGPNANDVYEEAESEAMAEIIVTKSTVQPNKMYLDTESTNSWGNIWSLAQMLEEYNGPDALGIVAAQGHSLRLKRMARKIIGSRVDFVPVPSLEHARPRSLAREVALTALFEMVTVGAQEGDVTSLEEREEMYDKLLVLPKEVLQRCTTH